MRCIPSHLKGEPATARSRGWVVAVMFFMQPTPRRTSPEAFVDALHFQPAS
jgi:hypothetical protein